VDVFSVEDSDLKEGCESPGVENDEESVTPTGLILDHAISILSKSRLIRFEDRCEQV
jgi:hypothetical protein